MRIGKRDGYVQGSLFDHEQQLKTARQHIHRCIGQRARRAIEAIRRLARRVK